MISVCILSKNGAETIAKALESVSSFPEVILLDTGSTDSTLSIATGFPNVRIYKTLFNGFGRLRNEAAQLASHDWIFALDCDEIISSALLLEIKELDLYPHLAYSMPRRNYYNGKWIKGCGWYPDRVIRLYHKKESCYSTAAVHESVTAKAIKPLKAPLLHTPCRSSSDFLRKMDQYSTLFAEEQKGKRSSSMSKALFHAIFSFIKSYVVRKGFLDGAEGFAISLYNANSTFYKYWKLAEANRNSENDINS